MSKRGKIVIVFVLSAVAIALVTGIVSAATYTLSGQVTDQSGSPLESAIVDVLDPGTGSVVASTSTDASGNYALSLEEGTYDVRVVPPPGSVFGDSLIQGELIEGDTALDVVLVPVPADLITISGRLVDSLGNPVANVARVQMTGTGGYSLMADASGRFSFQVAPGISRHIEISSDGYDSSLKIPRYYSLTGHDYTYNKDTDLGDLQIPAYQVDIHTQDPAGNPVANVSISTGAANIYVDWGEASWRSVSSSASGTTDANGDVSFLLFPTAYNQYNIFATPPVGTPFGPFTLADVTVATDKSIAIVLQFVHAPPATVASLGPLPDAQERYGDPVTVTLSATATEGYSVDATYYSIDGGPEMEYTAPFEVSGDGLHTIKYWSVDDLGVYETPKRRSFEIFGLRIVTESPLPDGTIGVPYTVMLEADGGSQPYSWSVSAGALPPGLELNADTGEISGIPTTAGSDYTQPITVVDTDPGDTGGTPACTNYEVIGGELPDGVTLDPVTGTISGTPLDGGTYDITVQCVVETGQTATREFTITINNPFPTLTSLDPASKRAESEGFVLALTGTNFVQSSIAHWNGSPRATTYVSDTQLLAQISADDIAFEGTAEVTVVNPEPVGGTSNVKNFTTLPANLPPTLDAGGPYSGQEGAGIGLLPLVNDPDGDPLTHLWQSSDPLCSFSNATIAAPTLTCYDDGSYTVTLTVSDGVHPPVSDEAEVTVANIAPTIALSGVAEVDEGSPYTLTLGAVTDPGDDAVTDYIVNWGDGSSDTYAAPGDVTHTYADGPASPTITVDLVDEDGAHAGAGSLAMTVNNVNPTITSLSAPDGPVNINDQPVTLEVAFTDPGILDTHEVAWDWGDGSSDTESGAASPAAGSHSYSEPGTYTVQVTVTDNDGGSDSESFQYVVIYDPEGGFVTGGGWIMSPEEAYMPDPLLMGKASFGFVSRYKKGADVPTGNTEFQFKAGDLNFHSSSYDWLVVAAAQAKFKGTGTINGSGNYGFMLSAVDAAETPSTDADLFRIKIWDKDDGDIVIYDNQPGDEEDAELTTEIGGGNVIVHTAK